MANGTYLALDIGERRIGMATASGNVAIAVPQGVITVDGTEVQQITALVTDQSVTRIIVGYPRNQSGQPTAQTAYVTGFVEHLPLQLSAMVTYQDESLTSVQAEQRLVAQGKPYAKGDIDSMAASIILQDYLEQNRGRL